YDAGSATIAVPLGFAVTLGNLPATLNLALGDPYAEEFEALLLEILQELGDSLFLEIDFLVDVDGLTGVEGLTWIADFTLQGEIDGLLRDDALLGELEVEVSRTDDVTGSASLDLNSRAVVV